MKIFVVFTTAVLVSVTKAQSDDVDLQGQVIENELLRTNRRVFSRGTGGWGSSDGGDSSGYRPGPPPGMDSSLMSLFNAMSTFGLSPSPNYGPPSEGARAPSAVGGNGPRPTLQYGPPPSNGNGGGRPPSSQYGAPPPASEGGNGGYQGGNTGGSISPATRSRAIGRAPPISPSGATGGTRNALDLAPAPGPAFTGAAPDAGKVFRYVSLFTAPDDPPLPPRKVIRAGPTTPDKHVNIIFVRPPTAASEQPVEVVLGPEPERRTIVYVLMKKPTEDQETVRVRPAPPTQPSKPEVFFIPYSDPSSRSQQPAEGPESGNVNNGGETAADGPGADDSSGGYNGSGDGNSPSGGYRNGNTHRRPSITLSSPGSFGGAVGGYE